MHIAFVKTILAAFTKLTTRGRSCTDKKWAAATAAEPSPNTLFGKIRKTFAALRCAAESGCEHVHGAVATECGRAEAPAHMPCYHPLHGYSSRHVNPTGKRSVVFKLSAGLIGSPVSVPCGRCIGCRLELSRQWALRCVHEAQLHRDSAFVTLTYSQENLPYGGTLIKKDFQDFMKRTRRHFDGKKLSYYHCGEYGERSNRPHYHALLFGVDFSDKKIFKNSSDGSRIYTSDTLQALWPAGFCTTGAVTFESAAYVARYVMKKITGKAAADHYETVEPITGEVLRRLPEYTTMSLKPAIGKNWYSTFKDDVFPSDFIVSRGERMKPPKYYDRLHELEDELGHQAIKDRREVEALLRQGDSTMARLKVREKCKLAQIANLKRGLE